MWTSSLVWPSGGEFFLHKSSVQIVLPASAKPVALLLKTLMNPHADCRGWKQRDKTEVPPRWPTHLPFYNHWNLQLNDVKQHFNFVFNWTHNKRLAGATCWLLRREKSHFKHKNNIKAGFNFKKESVCQCIQSCNSWNFQPLKPLHTLCRGSL